MDTNNKKIFIVVDNLKNNWQKEIKNAAGREKYHLLTFGLSPEQLYLPEGVQIVETSEISKRAEKEARNFYLKMPRLEILHEGRDLWWFLNISEKNIWTDKIIHRLYAFLRFHYVVERDQYDQILFYLDDKVMENVLKKRQPPRYGGNLTASFRFVLLYYYYALREIIKVIIRKSVLKTISPGTKSIPKTDAIGIFSIYPAWWQNPYSAKAVDIFLQAVPDELAKQTEVTYLIWLMADWRQLRKGRDFFKSRPMIILEQFLKPADFLAPVAPGLFLKFYNSLKQFAGLSFKLKGKDLSAFFWEEYFKSLTNPVLFEWLLLDKALRRYQLRNLKAVLFRLEFQPLERALLYNTRRQTTTFGFQHSALGKNFLNYVFQPNEFNTSTIPLPDQILTNGEIGQKFMTEAGFPAERLVAFGPIRYIPLFEYAKNRPSSIDLRRKLSIPLNKKIVFVATSPLLPETLCMLGDLLAAATQVGTAIHIFVKLHPNAKEFQGFVPAVKKLLRENIEKNSFAILPPSVSIYDYISASDTILLTGGSVALEAMVLGVVPIIYICHAQFSHNPMAKFPEAVFLVKNKQELLLALSAINDKQSINQIMNSWPDVIKLFFHDIIEDTIKKTITQIKTIEKKEILNEQEVRFC
ncbi:MAG: hypothetical protein FD145_33 [Candidatus Saganbacteria bacterium]|uniref:Uncharacterized protein n=1 Tax=Candidatus Saganbacteria bacterium TaxID=2575572 RepID=A0A833P0I5_UNCSA|nr:MAG: hypothetical protein FD145_33 [Candidatus Saganbacteria bacterium]